MTEIRKGIDKRAANYTYYSEPAKEVEVEEKSRQSVPHSTRKSNPEGMLESQISTREKLHAGAAKSCKKRHLKELPISTQEAIVKMYLDDHVFQKDIAKYYKISAALVSKLVMEAQRNPERNVALKVTTEEKREIKEAIMRVVTRMLENSVCIVNAEMVVKDVRRKEDIEVTIQ